MSKPRPHKPKRPDESNPTGSLESLECDPEETSRGLFARLQVPGTPIVPGKDTLFFEDDPRGPVKITRESVRELTKGVLHFLEIHTIPAKNGRKVPDVGSMLAINNKLPLFREYIKAAMGELLMALSGEEGRPVPGAASLLSALWQATFVCGPDPKQSEYRIGEVIPQDSLESLRSSTSILNYLTEEMGHVYGAVPSPAKHPSPARRSRGVVRGVIAVRLLSEKRIVVDQVVNELPVNRATINGPVLVRMFGILAQAPGENLTWKDMRRRFLQAGNWKGKVTEESSLRRYVARIAAALDKGGFSRFLHHSSTDVAWVPPPGTTVQ